MGRLPMTGLNAGFGSMVTILAYTRRHTDVYTREQDRSCHHRQIGNFHTFSIIIVTLRTWQRYWLAAEKWRKTRRLMNPAFSANMLRQYAVVFSQQARMLAKKLAEQADTGRQFDLWPYMANANVDIITGKRI